MSLNFDVVSTNPSVHQQHSMQQALKLLNDVYDDHAMQLDQTPRYWILAQHRTYGIIGGISLLIPTVKRSSSIWSKLVPDSQTNFTATHLFFHLDPDVQKKMSPSELCLLMHEFYQGLYQELMKIATLLKIDTYYFISAESQHSRAELIGMLPFFGSNEITLSNTDYIGCFLSTKRDNEYSLQEKDVIYDYPKSNTELTYCFA